MRTEHELAATLADQARGPRDVEALLATVRMKASRRRRRRVVGLGIATSVLVAAAITVPVLLSRVPGALGPAQPGPSETARGACIVQALPIPDEVAESLLSDPEMDPTGRFVVVRTEGWNGEMREPVSVLWDNGVPSVLDVPRTGVGAILVNAAGWVVGIASVRPDGQSAEGDALLSYGWVRRPDGSMITLPHPTGYEESFPRAVNTRGEIGGSAVSASAGRSVAVVWSPGPEGSYTVRVLPDGGPGGELPLHAEVKGIADDGTAVGDVSGRPYVWAPDGTGRELPLPAEALPWGPDRVGIVKSVRGEWVLGQVGSDTKLLTLLWNLRTGEVTATEPAVTMRIYSAVNARGDLVYEDRAGTAVDRGGDVVSLPFLPGLDKDRRFQIVTTLSDDGTRVAGRQGERILSVTVPPRMIPVLWRCPPASRAG